MAVVGAFVLMKRQQLLLLTQHYSTSFVFWQENLQVFLRNKPFLKIGIASEANFLLYGNAEFHVVTVVEIVGGLSRGVDSINGRLM